MAPPTRGRAPADDDGAPGTGSWWWAGSLQRDTTGSGAGPAAEDMVLIANDDTRSCDPARRGRPARAADTARLVLAQLYRAGDRRALEVGVRVEWPALPVPAVTDPAAVNCFSTRGLFLPVARIRPGRPLSRPPAAALPVGLRIHDPGAPPRLPALSDPEVRLWYNPTTTGIRAYRDVGAPVRRTDATRSARSPILLPDRPSCLMVSRGGISYATCSKTWPASPKACSRRRGRVRGGRSRPVDDGPGSARRRSGSAAHRSDQQPLLDEADPSTSRSEAPTIGLQSRARCRAARHRQEPRPSARYGSASGTCRTGPLTGLPDRR